ncbi:MAG TPA: class I SAM-dependent methyltransferase [Burkholderiaceae bacterium]|nr:class I SAM-dependent methyltransferase [Burkholderiaceae bacterium]
MNSTTHCPLCAGQRCLPTSERDRDGHPLINHLCQDCGLVFVDPPPSRAELDAWYADHYRQDYKGVLEPRPHHVLRAGRAALARLTRIRPLLAGRPRALDVGCGGGEMLYLLTHLGGARAEGLEPNRGYARHARERLELPVHEGFIERSARIGGDYDLITIHHVLEHLADPRAAMRILHGWLRPGGHLVVEVPNVESTCQAPAHTFHRAHLFTFGLPTLERLGLEAGLAPVAAQASPDGGNIEVIFVRDDHLRLSESLIRAHTDGYAQRVARVLQGHTTLRHYLSGRPAGRLAARLSRQIGERIALLHPPSPRAILDGLVAQARARGPFIARPHGA